MRILISLPLLIAAATAQSVIESLSFGYGQTISPNTDSIPGWHIGGEGHTPQILSNKLILTPPYPGNTRGYAWSQNPLSQPEWTVEFQFRATGVERGGGNLQLWYVKDGRDRIGSSSIYTAGQFDGFALVIDTHGGRGGSIRGFLNDGKTDYKSHRSVDSLAFGHCDYAYRNLGRPSVVRVKQTNSIFEVTVDDRLCFSTNKVALPVGNNFGLTAATPENPDSFEVFKFILQSTPSGTNGAPPVQQQTNQQPIANQQQAAPVDTSAVKPDSFSDLSNRLKSVNDATNSIARDISAQLSKAENRHVELLQKLSTKEQVAGLDARLQKIEQLLQNVQRDLEGKDYRNSFNQLHETLRSSHMSLSENLQGTLGSVITASTPRMGFFIGLLIAVQLLLAGSYIIYKRRRANMPKKFL
ncbi:putative lectin family integral membrane protein [Aspergillus clavatus NRRL 1]|uniref:Lectin family integral membrane protein, putative n=1 Tax=Aspergillus clavatus (strain ATCC 1007 / CBS 513.65 / DSM 816 / NCTC 3887 / NRRL 1 / QM 1276 / 107) TaxID=344612 RepID=A1C811_ASPCL|nr:lectin family integral membrane protein, putative [Aspergillus clavatus NRRL 1]EAW14532.1 lectin family integral membrane protein, putative [Aspergillus clavatus NRRL 1]